MNHLDILPSTQPCIPTLEEVSENNIDDVQNELECKRATINKTIILIVSSVFLILNALCLRRLNPKLSGVLFLGTVASWIITSILNPRPKRCKVERFLEGQDSTTYISNESDCDDSGDGWSSFSSD